MKQKKDSLEFLFKAVNSTKPILIFFPNAEQSYLKIGQSHYILLINSESVFCLQCYSKIEPAILWPKLMGRLPLRNQPKFKPN